ncbi:MAG TPA: hypothetical protein VK631_18355 [Solirubrobacteraceae bacterium]|nr:hypothetical protein [Solirubrobacteraceae bacterium]
MHYVCRVCGMRFPISQDGPFMRHVAGCVRRNEEFIDACRPPEAPQTGDPELLAFAMAEGDVYNRRPGTRKQAR